MSEKSYVSLEQNVCLVCGQSYETGSLLLDRRLRTSMQRHTTTGWGLCPEHQSLFSAGYVALVECDPQRSGLAEQAKHLQPDQAYRTGRVAHVKHELCASVFNVPISSDQRCIFVEPGVIERLQALTQSETD